MTKVYLRFPINYYSIFSIRYSLITISFLALTIMSLTSSGQPVWHVLPNSPNQSFRHDDLCFVNPKLGWVVNIRGEIWKTRDGGESWEKLIHQPTAFRCVGFIDSLRGFVGNLGIAHWANSSDSVPLYKTLDGGKSWIQVTKFSGPRPNGLCGLQVVNKDVIVACGRVDGPPFFIKSVDGGSTWTSKDMSAYAGMLIDVYFTSRDTGFIVGGTDKSRSASSSLIIYTTDGGKTWTTKIKDPGRYNHCWKITHSSKKTLYVSIEEKLMTDTLKYFKSEDGGATWIEKMVPDVQYGESQGIGFLNDKLGWIGGNVGYTLCTVDGGKSFNKMPQGYLLNLNRIRFVNDTLAYAVGQRVYKFCK